MSRLVCDQRLLAGVVDSDDVVEPETLISAVCREGCTTVNQPSPADACR